MNAQNDLYITSVLELFQFDSLGINAENEWK